jgi:hypothetical protein
MKVVSKKIKYAQINALVHESRRMYDAFVEEQSQKVSYNNKARLNTNLHRAETRYGEIDRYGEPQAKSPKDIIEHTKFLAMDKYAEIKREVSKVLRKAEQLNQINNVPKKKTEYNDLGLGVFTFSRAAMSLRKLYKGGVPVLLPNGKHKIVSDVRKVYAYRPVVNQEKDSVKLYILSGGAISLNADEMIYTGMGAVIIAEYLVENGYDVEINAVLMNRDDDYNQYGHVIKLKSYENDINVNDLLLTTASPRWYRFTGFKGIITSFDFFNRNCPSGLGSPMDFETASVFVEQLNKDSSTPVVLKRAYSKQAVINEVNRVLNQIKKAQISDE